MMAFINIYFLVILLACMLYSKQNDTCSKCLYRGNNNIWCNDPNFSDDRCITPPSESSCINTVTFKPPNIKVINNPSSKMNPEYIDIQNLKPGEISDVHSEITFPTQLHLEIYLLVTHQIISTPSMQLLLNDLISIVTEEKDFGVASIKLGIGIVGDKKYAPTLNKRGYEYFNVIPLTSNLSDLQKELFPLQKQRRVKNSEKPPLSIYNAIVQASSCTEQVGWSNKTNTLKMMFVFTEQISKTAGDAINMGIVRKFINRCQLNADGIYHEFRDYADDNDVFQALTDANINLIFMPFDTDSYQFYNQISQDLKYAVVKSIYVGNRMHLYKVIKTNIEGLIWNIEFIAPEKDDFVAINIYEGSKESSSRGETSSHLTLSPSKPISLSITVQPIICFPENKLLEYSIIILGRSKIKLRISTGCHCDCDNTADSRYEVKSDKCHNNGDFICGKCYCYSSYVGNYCDCSTSISNCKNTQDSTGLFCSGKGECRCNECFCSNTTAALISGNQCQCDIDTCLSKHNEFCSGESQGTCDCGVCKCKPGFYGNVCENRQCEHEAMKQHCVGSSSHFSMECSGRGACNCGRCICNYGFSGDHCEKELLVNPCNKFSDCVICQMYDEIGALNYQNCSVCHEMASFNIAENKQSSPNYTCITAYKMCFIHFNVNEDNESYQKSLVTIKKISSGQDCVYTISPLSSSILICVILTVALLGAIFGGYLLKYHYEKSNLLENPNNLTLDPEMKINEGEKDFVNLKMNEPAIASIFD